MKKLIAIIFILFCISCKQKTIEKETIIKDFDKQYFFGFEEKAFIDSNLTIPDSTRIYFDVPPWNILERYFVSDSSMCFKNENAIYIKAQQDLQIDTNEFKNDYFLIEIYENNYFGYKFRYQNPDDCATCSPDKTLIGKRLVLNKSEYKINDTVKGKLLLKYYVDAQCVRDSANRFKIRVDSILFKYKLYQSTKNIITDFKKDYNRIN